MSDALVVAPDVVYFPIPRFPLELATYKSVPHTATAEGLPKPLTRDAFCKAPAVVYFAIVPSVLLATKRSLPDTAIPEGELRPVIREVLIGAPDVVYRPTVPLPEFTTNKFDPE